MHNREAMERYALEGCQVELGTPALVERAPGHRWFSKLIPLEGPRLLCEIAITDDKAQGEWPALLCESRDGGRSWQRALKIPCYGPTSVALGPRRRLLLPMEFRPFSAQDKRNAEAAGTLLTWEEQGLATTCVPVRLLDFPRPLDDYYEGEVCLLTDGNILPLQDGRLFTTVYGKFEGEARYYHWAMHSRDGGFTWRYLTTVASWRDLPDAPEGPDESNTVRLADGRLLCLYRVGSGRPYPYHKSYSADEGATWSAPEPVADAWSVEPQLVQMENGLLLLSGGRWGLFLWVCADGEGRRWQRINLSEHHNARLDDPALHYDEAFCRAEVGFSPYQSTSYTGLIALGPEEALLSYDRLANGWGGAPGPWGAEDAVFCLHIRATRR